VYDAFLKKTRFSDRELNRVLWLTPHDAARQRKEGILLPEASNRLYQLALLFYLVLEWTENSKDDAYDWLHLHEYHLYGRKPMEVLSDAPGSKAVENILWHITEGFPSGL